MIGLTLRKATLNDKKSLQHWGQQPHVIAAAPNDEIHWGYELSIDPPWRELLIAELEDQPIGFIQIIDPKEEATHYWGDVEANLRAIDIWIGEKENLGKGYGTAMMRLAIQRCFENRDVKGILVDPLENNTKAHRFYEKLGFQFIERRRFGEDDCRVYKLSRTAWWIG